MAILKYRDPTTQAWVPLPNIAGPAGPAGPIGDTGPTGPAGVDEVVIASAAPTDPTLDLWVALDQPAPFYRKYVTNVGDGAATTITVTHSLGVEDVVVGTYYVASKKLVFTDVTLVDTNSLVLGFEVAPAVASVRVVVMG